MKYIGILLLCCACALVDVSAEDVDPDVLAKATEEACIFLKYGYFRSTALPLGNAALQAALTTLIPSFGAKPNGDLQLSDEEKANVIEACPIFAPLDLSVLTTDLGGEGGVLFGGDRGYNFDVLNVQAVCPEIAQKLITTSLKDIDVPLHVITVCISHFLTEVLPSKYGLAKLLA